MNGRVRNHLWAVFRDPHKSPLELPGGSQPGKERELSFLCCFLEGLWLVYLWDSGPEVTADCQGGPRISFFLLKFWA